MSNETAVKLSDAKPKLEYAFSIGCSVVEACVYADIARSTYYRWLEEDESLKDRFDTLQNKPVLKAKQVVDDSLTDGDVNTAKWYLERRSKDFKPKSEVTGEDGASLFPATIEFVSHDGSEEEA